jgi:hypothetical protein
VPESGATFPAQAAATAELKVPDDDAVLRRLSDNSPAMVYVDPLTGDQWPTTGAFALKRGEDGVSVYRERLLTAAGLGVRDVLIAPTNLVVRLTVADVRAVPPLDVRDDRWPTDAPDASHPRNGAHALIVGLDGLGKSPRKAAQRALVEAPSLSFVYP